MSKKKGKSKLKGTNPYRLNKTRLVRKKAAASIPVKCKIGEDTFNSLSEAARVKKRSRTYIARIAQRI